jgi:hypothetical protein
LRFLQGWAAMLPVLFDFVADTWSLVRITRANRK